MHCCTCTDALKPGACTMAGGSAAAGVPFQHRSSGARVSSNKHGPACAASSCPRVSCWVVASGQAAACPASMASKPQGDGSSSCQLLRILYTMIFPTASPDGRVHLQSADLLETGACVSSQQFSETPFCCSKSPGFCGSADCSYFSGRPCQLPPMLETEQILLASTS